jgi:hypothetical protein
MTYRQKIVLTIITGLITILAALIAAKPWETTQHKEPFAIKPAQSRTVPVSGSVVDIDTHALVPYANITFSGRTESYVTDANGNFHILLSNTEPDAEVRLRVSKTGYQALEVAVTPPNENVELQLTKSRK